jgi:hypothetical protein
MGVQYLSMKEIYHTNTSLPNTKAVNCNEFHDVESCTKYTKVMYTISATPPPIETRNERPRLHVLSCVPCNPFHMSTRVSATGSHHPFHALITERSDDLDRPRHT